MPTVGAGWRLFFRDALSESREGCGNYRFLLPLIKIMKETPINDMFAKNGKIREDGRMVDATCICSR